MNWGFVRGTWREFRSPLYRNALFLMANTVIGEALGFFFWIIAARFYPSSEVGLAVAAMTSLGFFASLANLGFGVGLVRYLPEAGERSRDMINSCLTISAVGGAVIAGVFLLGADIWAPSISFIKYEPGFVVTCIVVAAGLAIAPTIDAVFIARRRAQYVLYRQLLFGLRVPLPLVFVSFFGVFGIFGSWAVAILVAVVVALLVLVRRVEVGYRLGVLVRWAVVRQVFRFSLGNQVAGVIAGMPMGLLPLIIANMTGAVNSAYFYVAWMVAGMLYVIPSAAATSLYAEGSQPVADFPRDTRRAGRLIAYLMLPGILILYFFGWFVLGLFRAEYSDQGFGLLQLLALAGGFVAVNSVYMTQLRVKRRVAPIIALSAVLSGILLGVSYWLLPSMGIMAVGVGQLVAQGVVCAAVCGLWATGSR